MAPLERNERMLMSAALIPTVWPTVAHSERNCCVRSVVCMVRMVGVK